MEDQLVANEEAIERPMRMMSASSDSAKMEDILRGSDIHLGARWTNIHHGPKDKNKMEQDNNMLYAHNHMPLCMCFLLVHAHF